MGFFGNKNHVNGPKETDPGNREKTKKDKEYEALRDQQNGKNQKSYTKQELDKLISEGKQPKHIHRDGNGGYHVQFH